MFALKEGDIIPGIGIGPLKLGDDESSFLTLISEFSVRELPPCTVYTGEDVMIWVEQETRKISQILVFGSFRGKLLDRFGIGTYFSEMEQALGERIRLVYEIMAEYQFPSLPGVSFELEDLDIPDELLLRKPYETLAPIGNISVFIPLNSKLA